ncbi:MAG: hypothetical protein U0807_00835 [Candidatus Binatia bacterium]
MTIRRTITTVLAALLLAAPAAQAGPVGACITAAKDLYVECTGGCKEGFQVAKDDCLNRDHACVEACRSERADCREASGIDADLAVCAAQLETAKANCRTLYPSDPVLRDACIDNAQVDAFVCRDTVRENNHAEIKACRQAFKTCAGLCGPAVPPVDPATCKGTAKDAYKQCKADCREDFQLAKDICRGLGHNCVEACRAQRDLCNDGPQAILDAAIAACNATRDAGVQTCKNTFPVGPDRDACIDQVQVIAFQCRDQAREDARPGFEACREAFHACVLPACKGASPSGAFLE